MGKPFKGIVNIDIQDSTPDWAPYAQPLPADGAPNVLYIVLDDVGFSAMEPFGGTDRDAEHQANRRQRPDLHELPHDRALLADAVVPADRPQPHDERHGLHHRGDDGLPELERPHPVRVRDGRRGARRAGLEHVHGRQVAPVRRGRDEPGLDPAAVAGRPRLRALLRLPRRARRTSGIPTSSTTTTRSSSRRRRRRGTTSAIDITDKAIEFIRDAKAIAPDKPFFLYYCPGAGHAPHHAPKEWADKYKGKFDMGYEAYRELVFANAEEARDHPRARRAVADQPVHRTEGPAGTGRGRRSTWYARGTR